MPSGNSFSPTMYMDDIIDLMPITAVHYELPQEIGSVACSPRKQSVRCAGAGISEFKEAT